MQNVEPIDEITSEELKNIVGFEIDNKILKINIKMPLEIVDKEDYEAEYGEKYNVRLLQKMNLWWSNNELILVHFVNRCHKIWIITWQSAERRWPNYRLLVSPK